MKKKPVWNCLFCRFAIEYLSDCFFFSFLRFFGCYKVVDGIRKSNFSFGLIDKCLNNKSLVNSKTTSFLFSSSRIHQRFFVQNRKIYRLFIFFICSLASDVTIFASLILKQGVNGLKAFAFCILTVNDEYAK